MHPTLPRATAVRPNCSSLRSIAKHYVSAHETLAALESAIRQWSAENDSISGAFPVIDVRNLAGLQIQTAVLDLRSLIAEGDPLPSTLPAFGDRPVGTITKAEVLAFPAKLAELPGRTGEKLSNRRINGILAPLTQILNEAAERYEFASPVVKLKRLKIRSKTDFDPFSLDQVQTILATVRIDWRDYFTTRFLTGMRTGEAHGLKWKYVDFEHRLILVRETFVLGEDDETKTEGSMRDIHMSQPVFEALKRQFEATGKLSPYVFCNREGQPIDNKNFSDRVWYPLLRHLGLTKRRPYQMRHTAATLWLASGEAPEWIARQLGHANTQMLFSVYSRFVPNLTRQDGSAIDRLLATRAHPQRNRRVQRHTGGVPLEQVRPRCSLMCHRIDGTNY